MHLTDQRINRQLLKYVRSISQNLVPIDSPSFDPAYPGRLLHDRQLTSCTTDERKTYDRPMALVFMVDPDAVIESEKQDIPFQLRGYPVLPHWIHPEPDDGNCVSRAIMHSSLFEVDHSNVDSAVPIGTSVSDPNRSNKSQTCTLILEAFKAK